MLHAATCLTMFSLFSSESWPTLSSLNSLWAKMRSFYPLFARGDDEDEDEGEGGHDGDDNNKDDNNEDDNNEDDNNEDDNDESSDYTHLVSRGGRGEVQEGVRGVDQAR